MVGVWDPRLVVHQIICNQWLWHFFFSEAKVQTNLNAGCGLRGEQRAPVELLLPNAKPWLNFSSYRGSLSNVCWIAWIQNWSFCYWPQRQRKGKHSKDAFEGKRARRSSTVSNHLLMMKTDEVSVILEGFTNHLKSLAYYQCVIQLSPPFAG